MKGYAGYIAILIIGFGVRFAAFTINMPFQVDVNTFQAWAVLLYEGGLSNFYYADTFTDYPPMYMYVLWVVGAIRYVFDLAFFSPAFNLVTFMPAMICDVITGLLIYRLCRRIFADDVDKDFGKPFWISLAYLANPAVIINSSVWGQVDSIHTLLLFLALYAVSKKQTLPVYLLYGVAVLTKPQSLIVAPIFLYSAFYYCKSRDYSLKAAATMFGYAAAAFAFMAVLSLPFTPGFDLSPVIRQYADTLGSYPFASVNAYNFYALTGGNWREITPFYALVSILAISGVTFMSFWILHRHWNGKTIFFSAALLFIITFVFSVRMHERYLLPALLFLLVAAIFTKRKKDKSLSALYVVFSVTLFINCADVLLMFYGVRLFTLGQPLPGVFRPTDEAMALVSFVNVVMAVHALKVGWDIGKWTDI